MKKIKQLLGNFGEFITLINLGIEYCVSENLYTKKMTILRESVYSTLAGAVGGLAFAVLEVCYFSQYLWLKVVATIVFIPITLFVLWICFHVVLAISRKGEIS